MNNTEELLPTIKEYATTEELPRIPQVFKAELKKAYWRYEHFIGICSRGFEEAEIEVDRQKYPHLLFPDRDGLPVFCQYRCVTYMHKKSAIEYKYCAVQMYQEYLDLVASGFIKGEEREHIEAEYYLTLNLIEEFSKKPEEI